MYARMAEEADAEGFADIAQLFRSVGAIEKEHEERYLKLLDNVRSGSVLQSAKVIWICRNCGHIHEGPEAPESCPTCAHPPELFRAESNKLLMSCNKSMRLLDESVALS